MKARKVSKTTTNRYVFNRAHKLRLEQRGKIRCSYCKYHKGENYEGKWYGVDGGRKIPYDDMVECSGRNEVHTRYPNWKLVSKNRKQWMAKPIKRKIKYFGGYQWVITEIKFPA